MNFYRKLRLEQQIDRHPIQHEIVIIGPVLSIEQQLALMRNVTDIEVKNAIFSIDKESLLEEMPSQVNSLSERDVANCSIKRILQNR